MNRGFMGSLLPLGAWVRNPSLRSWPVLLFLLLLTVPRCSMSGGFPTDPIAHACLAGITGYFIGLAIYAQRNSGQRKWYAVCWVGLAIAAALHGLSDWDTLNGHWAWVAITVVSGILFLTYAKADPPGLPAAVASGRTKPQVQAPATGRTKPAGPLGDMQAEIDALLRELGD